MWIFFSNFAAKFIVKGLRYILLLLLIGLYACGKSNMPAVILGLAIFMQLWYTDSNIKTTTGEMIA